MTVNETLDNQYEGFQAEFYDIMHTDNSDADFYIEMVKGTEGNCLEIGSGTGRILIPIARAGCKISGLEPFVAMADKCGQKISRESEAVRQRITLHEGRMEDFKLPEKYGLIFIACNTFWHLVSDTARRNALRNIKSHLSPTGTLLIDVCLPGEKQLQAESGQENIYRYTNPANGNLIIDKFFYTYDPATGIADEKITLEEHHDGAIIRSSVANTRMRYVDFDGMFSLLRENGFKIKNSWKNYRKDPAQKDAGLLIIQTG